MATTGVYKMDDGNRFANNCFPARNIWHTGYQVLAKKAAPWGWTEKGTPRKKGKPPESAFREEKNEANVLDELFLMKHLCLKNPSNLCSVNISGQNLVAAKEDDFEKFDCLAIINATENLLTLEPFRKFPGLQELELSLNGVRNLKITAGDFLCLKVLDLSYNNLSPQDIWTLGNLSQLKVLRVTGNGLQSLPPDLAGSWDSAHLKFPSLEVLSLDDNHLSDPSVFVSLSHLCSLRELNLEGNRISAVPYLNQAESPGFFLHLALSGSNFRAEWCRSLGSLWQRPQPPQREDTEVPMELEAKKGQLELVMLQDNREPAGMEVVSNSGSQEDPVLVTPRKEEVAWKTPPAPSKHRDVCAPFPVLQRLSLAFNKITEETDLLPVAFFPCLKELTFHNNPLTTNRKGQPPLLTQLLQHKLGIKLVQQKSLAVERWHFSIPLRANRKVALQLPKVPKQPRLLEATAKPFQWKQFPAAVEAARNAAPLSLDHSLHSISSVCTANSQQMVMGEEESDSRPPPGPAEGGIESFMTQVEDVSRPPLGPMAEGRLENRSELRGEESSQVVPEQYKVYEELLSGDTDPDFIKPVGIQENVQATSYILKHPLVSRNARPQLHSVQKPYMPKKKCKRMLDPPARKTRAEVLDGILVAMRNTSNITEIPLVSVLQRKLSSGKYQEAQRLMKEFQEVFKIFPDAFSKDMAELLKEVQVVKTLPAEATSKQGDP